MGSAASVLFLLQQNFPSQMAPSHLLLICYQCHRFFLVVTATVDRSNSGNSTWNSVTISSNGRSNRNSVGVSSMQNYMVDIE